MDTEPRRPHWIFDCDGVLLDSNVTKTAAFVATTMRYGEAVSDAVVRHHLDNGGISRHVKLERMFHAVLRRSPAPGEMEDLLEDFAIEARRGLKEAAVDPAADSLLRSLRAAGDSMTVVSGGLEEEVRWILRERELAQHFDEICGSPVPKKHHVARTITERGTPDGVILVGDSREDLQIALDLGVRAVFVDHWSEFKAWRAFLQRHPDVVHVENLAALADLVRAGSLP